MVGSGREQVEPLVPPRRCRRRAGAAARALLTTWSRPRRLAGFDGDVLILYADTPFVTTETMRGCWRGLPKSPARSSSLRGRPTRTLRRILAEPDGAIVKMVEYKDASWGAGAGPLHSG